MELRAPSLTAKGAGRNEVERRQALRTWNRECGAENAITSRRLGCERMASSISNGLSVSPPRLITCAAAVTTVPNAHTQR